MKKGFTLIEVLVSLGVMVIILGSVAINYQGSGNLQTRDASAERLRQAMLQARSNAQAGKKDSSACGANSLAAWDVIVTSNSFTVQGRCTSVATPFYGHNEAFPTGVTISPATTVSFPPLAGNVTGANTFVITESGVSQSVSFSVWANGQVTRIQ